MTDQEMSKLCGEAINLVVKNTGRAHVSYKEFCCSIAASRLEDAARLFHDGKDSEAVMLVNTAIKHLLEDEKLGVSVANMQQTKGV